MCYSNTNLSSKWRNEIERALQKSNTENQDLESVIFDPQGQKELESLPNMEGFFFSFTEQDWHVPLAYKVLL